MNRSVRSRTANARRTESPNAVATQPDRRGRGAVRCRRRPLRLAVSFGLPAIWPGPPRSLRRCVGRSRSAPRDRAAIGSGFRPAPAALRWRLLIGRAAQRAGCQQSAASRPPRLGRSPLAGGRRGVRGKRFSPAAETNPAVPLAGRWRASRRRRAHHYSVRQILSRCYRRPSKSRRGLGRATAA